MGMGSGGKDNVGFGYGKVDMIYGLCFWMEDH